MVTQNITRKRKSLKLLTPCLLGFGMLCSTLFTQVSANSIDQAELANLAIHQNSKNDGLIYCVNGVLRELNPQRISRGITHDVLAPQIYDRLLRANTLSTDTTLLSVTNEDNSVDVNTDTENKTSPNNSFLKDNIVKDNALKDNVLKDNSYQPELTESWHYSEDYLKLTFKLRENVSFQTTDWFKPTRYLNADDVIFSFDRLINPNNPFYFDGNYPYFNAIDFAKRLKAIHKIDEQTVEFELFQPDSAFIAHLASYYSPILSKEYADQLLALQNSPATSDLSSNKLSANPQSQKTILHDIDNLPVGTGAFAYHDFLVDEYIRLVKHPDFWQAKPNFEQVIIDLSASGSGRVSKLLSKQCDMLAYPAAAQIPVIEKRGDFNLLERPSYGTAYLAFNTNKAPLNDPEIRRAIAFAINNERLMKSIYLETAETAGAFLPSYNWAFDPSIQITHFDPETGKKILKEKGIKKLKLTLSVSSIPHAFNPSPLKMAELIQADLSNIGIDVKILILDGISQYDDASLNTIDLDLVGWNSPNSDPDTFLRPVLSCAAIDAKTNYAAWCNADFERYLNNALLINNQEERKAYYHLAQQALAEELPILPLAYTRNVQVYNKSIQNIESITQGNFSFYRLKRDESAMARGSQ